MGRSVGGSERDIAARAAGLSGAERSAYLDQACGGDAGLRARVDALLAAGMDEPTATDAGVSPEAETGSAAIPAEHLGDGVIGNYRLLQVIGEGGFGVVYEAEQTRPVRRRVALKLLKPGMDSRSVLARFEAERQALAVMDHACIAKVLDAGETERGLPYFVMELVRGSPITEYCDRQRLTIRQRLELFARVCDAVQHAHTKAIIHRDIKPTNVLVEATDDGPVPKVIDFGIAKAMAQKLTEKTLFTERGQVIGTPEYMSPEQAEMSGEDIDTRSDVYSLGVLLYELLTGERPFDLKKAAFIEIQRVIREVDPPKPSTRLTGLGETGTRIAECRRTDLRSLSGTLRRELEWIPLKALRKDRTERYGTAADLAEDVRRYIAGEALEAGPPSAGYRLRKFVRRNRVGLSVGGLLIAITAVGFAATAFGFRTASNERDRARAALEAAADAREEAEQTLEFFLGRFEDLDPEAGQMSPTMELEEFRQFLENTEHALEGDVLISDGARARTLIALGEIYVGSSDFAAAQRVGQTATEIAERVGVEEIRILSRLLLAEIAYRDGDPAGAERLTSEALTLARASLADPIRIASIITEHGNALKFMERYEDARSAYDEASRLLAGLTGRDADLQRASTLYNRGLVLWRISGEDADRYSASLAELEQALAIRLRWLSPEDPRVLYTIIERAALFLRSGNHERACTEYEASLPDLEKLLPNDHWRLNEYRLNYGTTLFRSRRFDEALQACLNAYEGYKQGFGPESCRTVLAAALVARAAVSAESPDAAIWIEMAMAQAHKSGCDRALEITQELQNIPSSGGRVAP